MDEQIEDEISHDDSTPSVLQQAEKEGWNAAYYHFGKAEGQFDYFNPSIVERDDGIWLIVRRSEPHPQGFRFGQNFIWAFMMDEEGKVPKKGIRLRWKEELTDQHFEDPRGFFHPDLHQTLISACTFIWYPEGRWTGAHQCIGSFDDEWLCSKMDYPKLGGSSGQLDMIHDKTKYQKNWLPFLHDNHLHILYKADPWSLFGFGTTWSEVKEYRGEGVKWAYGDVRGGTAPVRVGDLYFTFPHSSLPWRGRYRRYYAGAMAFDANPPFTPRFITPEPLLRGSQNDPWTQKKPLVIFPCGALYRDEKWLVTCGVNDLKAAWVEIPNEDLLKRMVPIQKSGGSIFPASGLSPSEVWAKRMEKSTEKIVVEDYEKNLPVPVLDEPRTFNESFSGEARDIRGDSVQISPDKTLGGQKLSDAEILKQKRQSNAAKARAALAEKRKAKVEEFHLPEDAQKMIDKHGTSGEIADGGGTWCVKTIKPKKRRRKRFKRITSEARQKALAEYEKKKSIAP